jgi:uncharacterized membrane protein YgcG
MLVRSTPAEASEAAAPVAASAATAPADSSLDGDAWRDYELDARLNTIPVWDEFLRTHSTGFIANLARGQRAKLLAEPPAAAAPAPATVAAIPPETKTRTLSREEEPPSRRERRREARHARGGGGGGGGGGGSSSGCGAAKRTLRAAVALGFDNRDGVITAVHAKCGR